LPDNNGRFAGLGLQLHYYSMIFCPLIFLPPQPYARQDEAASNGPYQRSVQP